MDEVDINELGLDGDDEVEVGLQEREVHHHKQPTSPQRDRRTLLETGRGAGSVSALACCREGSVVSQQRWARCAQATLYLSYAIILLLASCAIYLLISRKAETETAAFVVGGIALFAALPLSFYDMHQHLSHIVSPLQIRYVRVLFMVPLYAVESWCALFFKEQRMGLELARELYEALVIYNTFMLMVDFLGGPDRVQALLRGHGTYARHIFCLQRVCKGWHVDTPEFYRRATLCVLQYVVVRVTLALGTFVLALNDRYCEGQWRWGSCAYPYFTLALSASQFAAIYGLFVFVHELAPELQPIRPWLKLVCVKVIVFATFYLAAALSIAQLFGFITPYGSWSASDVTAGIVNLTVCCMCALVAVLHHFAFGLKEFQSLESLIPSSSTQLGGVQQSLGFVEGISRVLPAVRDVVDVPAQVGKDLVRVMLGTSSGEGIKVEVEDEDGGGIEEDELEEEREGEGGKGEKGGRGRGSGARAAGGRPLRALIAGGGSKGRMV